MKGCYSDLSCAAQSLKTATCKHCGALISRDIEAIEAHIEECSGPGSTSGCNFPPPSDLA